MFFQIFLLLFTKYHAAMKFLIIHEENNNNKKTRKYAINIVIHLLAKQNDNFLKKNEFDW